MKTLVTGATGLIGSNLVEQLTIKGYEVHILVRDKQSAFKVFKDSVTYHEGDITNPEDINRAIKNTTYLFHLAADYRLYVPDDKSMININVRGTQNIMHAALKAGVKKIVYTSSVCTLGSFEDGRLADEETPSSLTNMISIYKKTKYMAEQEVLKLIKKEKLPAVIVNPSTPIGAGDRKPTPTGAMILNIAKNGGLFYSQTGLNVANVKDIAAGHILALEKGHIGEKYILGGENLMLKEIFEITATLSSTRLPKIKLPLWCLYPIAFVSETLAKFKLIKTPVATIDSIKMSKKIMFYSSDKAIRELGYTHGTAKEAITSAIKWFKHEGII